MMVRYPVDGMDQNNQVVKILPKVENQIWFGSEEDSNDEKIERWFWTKIMNTRVRRIHVGAQNGNVYHDVSKTQSDDWKAIEEAAKFNVGNKIIEMHQVLTKVNFCSFSSLTPCGFRW